MKAVFLIFSLFIAASAAFGQAFSSQAEILTVYSQNGKFYLKSTPFDSEFPTDRGKTSVYETGGATPLYVFERGFDSVDDDSNNLILSNDGETIFYLISWDANEQKEGLKSITIYKKGRIFKSFTETEITNCDEKKERCSLVYSNYEEVVDREKSNWGTRNYKKAFKTGVSEKEKFLSDFPLFSFDDTVYLTDSKKRTHIFDLKEGKLLKSEPFDDVYEQIKDKAKFVKVEIQTLDAPVFLSFPKLKNGKSAYESLADFLGMKSADSMNQSDAQYKLYSFKVNGNLAQDGSFEVENIEFFGELPSEKILEFFKNNKFDARLVPKEAAKWNVGDEYFQFRKKDDKLARQEREQEKKEQLEELKKNMTAETIGGVYIPKNLSECFTELDRLLSEISKKEMLALKSREDMIQYHLGLGMWMRNNWRLWGGSRLQQYFVDKGITHPEDMSSVILYGYYDWLNGKKDAWKDWEKNPKQYFQK